MDSRMSGLMGQRRPRSLLATTAMAFALAALAGCAAKDRIAGVQKPAPAEPPPVAQSQSPTPPPVDLAGRWKLAAAAGGACLMNFGDAAGAAQGTIAPEGGCPGNFFTSRKWAYEHDALIIRNHKGEPLAQLSFIGGHFEGKTTSGSALTLTR